MHDVWIEPGKVSQQIDRVIKCGSSKLDDVTMTVFFQSPIARSLAWSLSEWTTLNVCFPVKRALDQQAVSL
jgi:hypothetical protein